MAKPGKAPLCCPPNFDALSRLGISSSPAPSSIKPYFWVEQKTFLSRVSLFFPLTYLQSLSCVDLQQSSPPRCVFPRRHLIPNPAETLIVPSGRLLAHSYSPLSYSCLFTDSHSLGLHLWYASYSPCQSIDTNLSQKTTSGRPQSTKSPLTAHC